MVAYLSSHNVAGMLSCFDEEMEWLDVPMEASYRGKAEIGVFLDSLFDAFLGVLRDMALMPPLRVSETLVGRGALGMGVAASRLTRALIGAIQARRR